MERTIAAISTPQGNGGIAVIRISGNDAVKVADKVFFGSKKLADCDTHTVHYGFIKNEKGEKVNEVLASDLSDDREISAGVYIIPVPLFRRCASLFFTFSPLLQRQSGLFSVCNTQSASVFPDEDAVPLFPPVSELSVPAESCD